MTDIAAFSCADLRPEGQGRCADQVFLVETSDASRLGLLLITLGGADGTLHYFYPELLFRSTVAGFEVIEDQTLRLWTTWPGIGRRHWTQEIELDWNGDGLDLRHYEVWELDTITVTEARCAVDLTTGQYVLDVTTSRADEIAQGYTNRGTVPSPDLTALAPYHDAGTMPNDISWAAKDWDADTLSKVFCEDMRAEFNQHVDEAEQHLRRLAAP